MTVNDLLAMLHRAADAGHGGATVQFRKSGDAYVTQPLGVEVSQNFSLPRTPTTMVTVSHRESR